MMFRKYIVVLGEFIVISFFNLKKYIRVGGGNISDYIYDGFKYCIKIVYKMNFE